MNDEQKNSIVRLVESWLGKARAIYALRFPMPEVRFDLSGASAGQIRLGAKPVIRFNAEIAESQFDEFCARTVPHEVAHLVSHRLAGRRKISPHGKEWQRVMQDFGLEPSRCHDFDLSQVLVRRQSRYPYQCGCRQHQLSATRHYRVLRGLGSYRCASCGEQLQALPEQN